jgi:hypothetical protein
MNHERLTEIESRVRETLQEVMLRCFKEGRKDGEWTAEIKRGLTALGRCFGYKVRGAYPDRVDHFEDGWVWDLAWVEVQNGTRADLADGNMMEVPLALESEWNTSLENEILWDFQKLLIGRIGLRVMIFQAASSDKASRCFDRLTQEVRQYSATQAGDRYLIACWLFGAGGQRLEFRELECPDVST